MNKDPNGDPNENYNIVEQVCKQVLDKHFPTKVVKFNKHRHKKSSWITIGIITSLKHRDKLYRQLKMTPVQSAEYIPCKINLNTYMYNNILRKNMQQAKKNYYDTCFTRYKGDIHDIRNTWVTVKEVLNKTKKKRTFPDLFKINGENVSDKQVIANGFNQFFTEIGPKLANQIKSSSKNVFQDFLQNPCEHN